MRPYFAILAVLAAAVSSCVYPYDLPELAREQAFLVVDGSIVVGKEASLRISWINKDGISYTYTNPDEWWVEDENGTRYLPERDKQWMDLSQAPEDRSYRMVVKTEGKTYSSSFEKGIDKPIIESIDFGTDEARVYCNVSLRESDAGVGYVALSFEEIWLFHAQYPDQYELKEIEPGSEETPGVYEVLEREKPDESRYWCWRYAYNVHETLVDLTNLNGAARDYRLTSFARAGERNHGDYNIKVYARSISEAEYRFRRNLESSSTGFNLFTPNPGEVAGNVRCEEDPSQRVMGYVTLSLFSSKEARLDGRYYKHVDPGTAGFVEPLPTEYWLYYYEYKFRPIVPDYSVEPMPILWGPVRCIDCVEDGGSLEKPSFK